MIQTRVRPLMSFAFVYCENDREAWYRCVSLRIVGPNGELRRDDTRSPEYQPCYSELSVPLARRLAERLCDRYGINDRGGLMCGRIFDVR